MTHNFINPVSDTAQKMELYTKDFFSKCNQFSSLKRLYNLYKFDLNAEWACVYTFS